MQAYCGLLSTARFSDVRRIRTVQGIHVLVLENTWGKLVSG